MKCPKCDREFEKSEVNFNTTLSDSEQGATYVFRAFCIPCGVYAWRKAEHIEIKNEKETKEEVLE